MKEGLQHRVSGKVHFGEDAVAFARERLWNRAVEKTPYAVIECRTEQDVQRAIGFAGENERGVSVLGCGNDPHSRGVLDGGVVLDVGSLSSVAYDGTNGTVTVGGGARTFDLNQGLPADRVVPTGDVSFVGVTGLTLGGGYSKLLSRFGLALDNLTSVRIVLADGSVVIADEKQESDLFWALRGGGGNFGAVTSLTFKVHEVPAVLNGMVFIPLRFAKAWLLSVQEMLDGAPDALSISWGMGTSRQGERGLAIWPLWSGVRDSGDLYFDRVVNWEGATVIERKWSSYSDSFNVEAEKAFGPGMKKSVTARSLPRLDEAAAEAFLECCASAISPKAWILAHDFRGAASRIACEATAFSLRREHINVNIIDGCAVGADISPHVEWVRGTAERLSAIALPGGYVNLLGPQERSRVRDFYGEGIQRLAAVKKQVDPNNLFRSNVGQF